MDFRLSLLGAAAMAALFAQTPAQAGSYRFSTCSSDLYSLKCAANQDDRTRTRSVRDEDNDHGSDRNKDPNGGKDSGNDGGGNGSGNGGGNGGGGEGGEGGEGGS